MSITSILSVGGILFAFLCMCYFTVPDRKVALRIFGLVGAMFGFIGLLRYLIHIAQQRGHTSPPGGYANFSVNITLLLIGALIIAVIISNKPSLRHNSQHKE